MLRYAQFHFVLFQCSQLCYVLLSYVCSLMFSSLMFCSTLFYSIKLLVCSSLFCLALFYSDFYILFASVPFHSAVVSYVPLCPVLVCCPHKKEQRICKNPIWDKRTRVNCQ